MARHRPARPRRAPAPAALLRRAAAPSGARRRPARLGAALVVALALLVVAAPGPAGAAGGPAPVSVDAARRQRAALLLRAAQLTDQLESSQAGVVAVQLRRTEAATALAGARARMRARAVAAYTRGAGRFLVAFDAPGPYLEVAAAKDKAVVDRYRRSLASLTDLEQRAEAAAGQARDAQRQLAGVQAQLDGLIAADDARRADEQRRADDARRAAQAAQADALAAARSRAFGAGPAGVASAGGYDPVPLDANALLPRHWAATNRQLAVMRGIPFGPLAGGRLPAGLHATGQLVTGLASWYGPGFDGRPTASGAVYDQEGWTVASKELPLGTLLVVGMGTREVLLLVNDRGPYVDGRVLDLSAAAARALGVGGVAPVWAEVVGWVSLTT